MTIIGIDPGAGGAIALFSKGKVAAVNMPEKLDKRTEYFRYLKDTYPESIVFIEKVQAFVADDEAPGKKFAINKMLKQYAELITQIRMTGLMYVEVYPQTWQSELGLRRKGMEKQDRKSLYKDYSQRNFPQIKVTLKTSDALCLVLFGREKIENDIDYIFTRVENYQKGLTTLF